MPVFDAHPRKRGPYVPCAAEYGRRKRRRVSMGRPVAANLQPALTTVALPHYEMGAWAAGQLIDAIEGTARLEDAAQQPTLLACPLVVRDSVTAPKS
jgi:DNA-binding LacI/PurR family transcriptional regulator